MDRGRVIRFSEDKTAELFTLVIKGTMEEQWFKKSTGKMDYVSISEKELNKVLNNESLEKSTDELDIFNFQF